MVSHTRFDLSGTSGLRTFSLEAHNYIFVSSFEVLAPCVLSHDLEWEQPGIMTLDTLLEGT